MDHGCAERNDESRGRLRQIARVLTAREPVEAERPIASPATRCANGCGVRLALFDAPEHLRDVTIGSDLQGVG
jgi:hypothetical protein